MTRIVLKFGGTSMGGVEQIQNVAQIIKSHKQKYDDVVVVVSAMSGTTNHLVALLQSISQNDTPTPAHDAVLATGEQVATGLLTLALKKININAQSFQGWQIPIITTDNATNANIQHIDTLKIEDTLTLGVTPIISGFQGITEDHIITTLGRGGSDTTAVAMALALDADACFIYTDVNGVYSCDPRLVESAQLYESIPLDIMQIMAQYGAKVMHETSLRHAINTKMPIHVLNAFDLQQTGTCIQGFADKNAFKIYGLAQSQKDALYSFSSKTPHPPSFVKELCLKFPNIDVASCDLIDGQELQFLAPHTQTFYDDVTHYLVENGFVLCDYDPDITKISIIGTCVRENIKLRNAAIISLECQNIIVSYVYYGDLHQTYIIPQSQTAHALKILHEALKLTPSKAEKTYAFA